MRFQVGDIVVREGRPVYQRVRVEKTYQDSKGIDRMTTKDLRLGAVGANRRQDEFVPCPYYPSSEAIERTKQALSPEKVFKLGRKKYLVLPRRLVPELVVQHLIADGLIAEDPSSLGWVLWHVVDKTYAEYRRETEAIGKRPISPTAYAYELLMSLDEYNSRWWR